MDANLKRGLEGGKEQPLKRHKTGFLIGIDAHGITKSTRTNCTTIWFYTLKDAVAASKAGWINLEGFVTKFVLSIEMRNAIPCIVVRNKHSYKLKQMYAMFGNLFQRSNLPALNLVETWK